MIDGISTLLRERYRQFNPLYKLRKSHLFVTFIIPRLNFSIPASIYQIKWKVWVHLIRDISWILNSRVHNPELASLFLAIGKVIQPRVFWDVGANIGFFSWLLLSQDQAIQVTLFEPDPVNISLLKKTIQQASLRNIQLVTHAVSNQVGQAEFAVDFITGATGTLEVAHPTFIQRQYGMVPNLIQVETITLDSVLDTSLDDPNGSPPDLIKVDVEGADLKVFEGAINLITTFQPMLIFEASKENRDKILSILKELKYQVFDAEKPHGDLDRAYNILAIPKRYQPVWTHLLEVWKTELTTYNSSIRISKDV
ncbi:MAG: FkbM family methyltransferase [Microcoleaceae cyanobacterium]